MSGFATGFARYTTFLGEAGVLDPDQVIEILGKMDEEDQRHTDHILAFRAERRAAWRERPWWRRLNPFDLERP